MKNMWQTLPKPFFVLAPMEDVTDSVFRRMVAQHGRPDIFFTEFTNVDALLSPGRESALQRLQFTDEERPIIAQIWGTRPEKFYEAAQLIVDMGFDGIDINMGCPQRDIIKDGSCSALIKNHQLAGKIIAAVKNGAGKLPVSVKTRIGFSTIQTEEWISFLLEQNIAALTIHARTVKEMSLVPAHWEEVAKVVKIRDEKNLQTVVIGNGDITSKSQGLRKVAETGCDGIMVGRGIFHDLFLFGQKNEWIVTPPEEKIEILRKHVLMFEKTWGGKKSYNILKKYFKIYISGFGGASDMRVRFMETKTPKEALSLAEELSTA